MDLRTSGVTGRRSSSAQSGQWDFAFDTTHCPANAGARPSHLPRPCRKATRQGIRSEHRFPGRRSRPRSPRPRAGWCCRMSQGRGDRPADAERRDPIRMALWSAGLDAGGRVPEPDGGFRARRSSCRPLLFPRTASARRCLGPDAGESRDEIGRASCRERV